MKIEREISLLMKEYYENKQKINNIKEKRFKWHEARNIECSCSKDHLDWMGRCDFNNDWKNKKKIGMCNYCKVVNIFYEKLQTIHKKQRSISLKVRSMVKNIN